MLSNIAEVQNENRKMAFGLGYFDFASEDLWEDSFSEIIRAKTDKDFRRKCGDKAEVVIQILLLKHMATKRKLYSSFEGKLN